MAKPIKSSGSQAGKRRAALTPEGRENQLIDLAVSLVEKRLLEGTASSQEVTTILKLGTTRARLENGAAGQGGGAGPGQDRGL